MALNANVASTWKELTAHGRADAWKDIVEGFQNVEGVWTVIYSSGALIGFSDYSYPIPVMAGWKYRVGDTGDWVKVTENGEINTSGTFTGVVKATSVLTLNEWYSDEGVEIGEKNLRMDGTPLSKGRDSLTSFVNGGRGYVCGGGRESSGGSGTVFGETVVDIYDSSGNRTTGTALSQARRNLTSFVNNSKGYVCGGINSSYSNDLYSTVDVYDSSGNRSTGTSLSVARSDSTSFVNNSKGYVCGGVLSNGTSAAVDVYDSSGNRTTGNALSYPRSVLTSFVNGNKGYVCGGAYGSVSYDIVDVYDSSGNRTTGTNLELRSKQATSFVLDSKGYVCGGMFFEASSGGAD